MVMAAALSGKDIIHNADTALYHSKLEGRNRAYANVQETFVDFSETKREKPIFKEETPTQPLDPGLDTHSIEASAYLAANIKTVPISQLYFSPPPESENEVENSVHQKKYTFLSGVCPLQEPWP